jgi:hypothetical protein
MRDKTVLVAHTKQRVVIERALAIHDQYLYARRSA